MAEVPSATQRYIQDAIAQTSPRSLLELAPAGITADIPDIVRRQRYTLTESFSWADIAGTAPSDLAVVIDAPCYLRRIDVERVLAYLRNAGAQSILAVQPADTMRHREPWHIKNFLALGFRQAEGAGQLPATHQVYRYDLRNYKITPDWLNASDWANPERWDRERW